MRTVGQRRVPQRPALRRRLLPVPGAGRPRPRGGGHRRGGRAAGRRVQARRPRHRVPVGVLRSLRLLPDRPDQPLPVAAHARQGRRRRGSAGRASRSTSSPTSRRYAEQMLVHENAIVKMRDDMPLDRAALIGCGVTTGVGAVLNTARVEAGLDRWRCSARRRRSVGDPGRAHRRRAHDHRRRRARAQARRRHASWARPTRVDASAGDPVKAIREMTGGGVEYSFEAIGLKQRRRAVPSSACGPAARRRSSA